MRIVQDEADLDNCPHPEPRKMFVDSGDTLSPAPSAPSTDH